MKCVPSPAPLDCHQLSERYVDALREVQHREHEVLRLVATIRKAAQDLEHWRAVFVAHAGAGFPKEVTMTGRAIDAATWPSARELADALEAWHAAAEVAQVAWARLPPDARAFVSPPP